MVGSYMAKHVAASVESAVAGFAGEGLEAWVTPLHMIHEFAHHAKPAAALIAHVGRPDTHSATTPRGRIALRRTPVNERRDEAATIKGGF